MNFTKNCGNFIYIVFVGISFCLLPLAQGEDLKKKTSAPASSQSGSKTTAQSSSSESELAIQPESILSKPEPVAKPEPISRDSLDLSYKRVETAQLEIKLGIDYFSVRDNTSDYLMQEALGGISDELKNLPSFPIKVKGFFRPSLTAILQIPVLTPEGNFKWLVQAGIGRQSLSIQNNAGIIGQILEREEAELYDSFCAPFFIKNDPDSSPKKRRCQAFNKTKRKIRESAFWYIPVQTGFQYNLKPFSVLVSAGGFFGFPNQYGGTGELVVGWNFSDKMSLSAGAEALYYDDKLHWGYSVALGFYGKKWTQRLF